MTDFDMIFTRLWIDLQSSKQEEKGPTKTPAGDFLTPIKCLGVARMCPYRVNVLPFLHAAVRVNSAQWAVGNISAASHTQTMLQLFLS